MLVHLRCYAAAHLRTYVPTLSTYRPINNARVRVRAGARGRAGEGHGWRGPGGRLGTILA